MKDTKKGAGRKIIEIVLAPPAPHMVGDGFYMRNFIPGIPRLNFQRMDPFLVLDYNPLMVLPPSETPKGVGVHPHKGFETVTISYHGSVAHQDSTGSGGVIREGDVQWMTAAGGILHKEFHEKEFSKKGGSFQMIQLWVNLPAKFKKSAPKYQNIQASDIQKYVLEEEAGTIDVVVGSYKGIQGPASTFTPVHLYNARIKKGKSVPFSFPSSYTTLLLVVEGLILVNDEKEVATDHLLLFGNQGTEFSVEAKEDAVVFVLSGEPIKEPIAAHGPFVMNTRDELVEAFNDFNTGKFGYLE